MLFHHDMMYWVTLLGYIGVVSIIFVETGLFAFFLPGDSLLFTAGFLASQNVLNVWFLTSMSFVAAVVGYFISYWLGKKLGHWLMKRKDSIWFKKHYLEQAHQFYEKHGGKALVLGRLMPVIRTFVPVVAGMGKMTYSRYVLYNVLGAAVWIFGLTLLGYYLGQRIPNAEHYILPITFVIILVSLTPAGWHLLKGIMQRSDVKTDHK